MSDNRHLDPENFAEAVSTGVPLEYPIVGNPRLSVFINPSRHEIGLRAPRASQEGKIETGLMHVRCRSVLLAGKQHIEVVVDHPDMFAEGYAILCLVADRIQLSGHSVSAAVTETIRSLGQLLRGPGALSPEREVGLFGELVTLRSLISCLSPEDAVGGWLGPVAEEHDFSLLEIDLEAKSTLSENREHWISSLTQLLPKVGKPLWLVSHQFTAAGPGQGKTLAELVAEVRAALGSAVLADFDRRLTAAGWRGTPMKDSGRRFRARTSPALYRVDETFPRLTPANLTGAGVHMSSITEVRYRLDLSAVPLSHRAPSYLRSALTSGGTI
ncbi:PD-(D/E)XK motif protein [[Kitasatospora] papulosa]|uniref:PD-(D/E)XK motif protein n=1 Tax=[Kitasatospora] papulosa TaxID=1464011 RepID=UPI00224D0D4D|nr:PD-(D/E)XK motif protein [[Kitasatospora] papulosa]MCX4414524.1 PD-(D/E)XK motif protein [[Kitasatospora] papulosa]